MKLPVIVFAGAAAALAGTALAASPRTHAMNVPLPDGSVARVEYVGNVAPKVTIAPAAAPAPADDDSSIGGAPNFASFDRMFERMDRQMRQVEQMARQPGRAGAPGMNVASQPAPQADRGKPVDRT